MLDRGSRGETAALTGDFALVLLDLTLPGKDGLEVLSVARDGPEVPLTAREFEVLVYLRSGPDRNGPQRRVPAARPSPLGPAPGKPAD